MNHQDLHTKLSELLYIEDGGMYDILLASVVANAKQLGDPVWLTLIGPSSGGKSQIIRPFGKSRPKFIHQLDDITANSLISGSLGMDGSLLGRIGKHGIISMDDLTVLFSKAAEERAAVLSQFRMLYDGRFSKTSGNRKESMVWEGYLGMLAGSTPQIYRIFNDVADMGERFVIYRMKPYNEEQALNHIIKNPHTARQLDSLLSELLHDYLQALLDPETFDESLLELDEWVYEDIKNYARHCARLRTPVHLDERSGLVDEFPQPEMPMRVMNQLIPLAKGLQVVYQAKLTPETIAPLLWVAYSLSNDKRRAYLRTVVGLTYYSKTITSQSVSAVTGLHSEITKHGLDQLQALKIIELIDDNPTKKEWRLTNNGLKNVVMRLDPPPDNINDMQEIW